MSSETKGTGHCWPQLATTTPFHLQNGFPNQGGAGQHLDRPQADIHAYLWTGRIMSTCGTKKANSIRNGYDRPPLAETRGHVRLDVAGRGCQAELMSVRWNQPLGNGLQHRVSVNYSLRECRFVARQTEPHLCSQFRGRGNCGPAAEQQSGSVREALLKEPNASDWTRRGRDFNSVLCTSNGGDLGREVMLYTKEHDLQLKRREIVAQGCLNGAETRSSKRSQKAIQDQIKNVVVNLEEVLRGLKDIHLEMKEVVQEIDLLTAGIDMGEPNGALSSETTIEPKLESPRCRNSVRSSNKALPPCTMTPPAYPIGDQAQPLGLDQEIVNSQRQDSRTATGHWEKKPPPYPYASTTGRVNTKAKGQKAPPYPFRRRLLSTIV